VHDISFPFIGKCRDRCDRPHHCLQPLPGRVVLLLAANERYRGFASLQHPANVGDAQAASSTTTKLPLQRIEVRAGCVRVLFQPLERNIKANAPVNIHGNVHEDSALFVLRHGHVATLPP
jgi:hypothetical protein